MKAESMTAVMCVLRVRDLGLTKKSGNDTIDETLELEKNLRVKHYSLFSRR